MVVGQPPQGAHLPLPPGRGDRGGSPCRGGVENDGPWWSGGALEVAHLLLARCPCCCCWPELEKKGWSEDAGVEEGDQVVVGGRKIPAADEVSLC
ncbi:hypothetical protein OIU78_004538 [Salix suchowensis]|nr:hypothetical protein OIU78_004538 [Salix suchowensis]